MPLRERRCYTVDRPHDPPTPFDAFALGRRPPDRVGGGDAASVLFAQDQRLWLSLALSVRALQQWDFASGRRFGVGCPSVPQTANLKRRASTDARSFVRGLRATERT